MRTILKRGGLPSKHICIRWLLCLVLMGSQLGHAHSFVIKDTLGLKQYRGKVLDEKANTVLVSAMLILEGTNISTVTNGQGQFLLKVPARLSERAVRVSHLGYVSKTIALSEMTKPKTKIRLRPHIERLAEVSVGAIDARLLVRKMLSRKHLNYPQKSLRMIAFYRETIQKRRDYASLSEAVLDIGKQGYTNRKNDVVKLYKSRKQTNYKKLDTLAFKLMGGPYNSLSVDLIKYPDFILTEEMLEKYDVSFTRWTSLNNRSVYVIGFKQKPPFTSPHYYGELYVDAESFALVSANYQLNLEDRKKSRSLFTIRKPRRAVVYPTKASFQVHYRERNGKWFYEYSKIDLKFTVDWLKKLFNAHYTVSIEMAITDLKSEAQPEKIKARERLKRSVIISDAVSGFSDSEFWGEYNIIEPEKSIKNAIKKIRKQLKRKEARSNK